MHTIMVNDRPFTAPLAVCDDLVEETITRARSEGYVIDYDIDPHGALRYSGVHCDGRDFTITAPTFGATDNY